MYGEILKYEQIRCIPQHDQLTYSYVKKIQFQIFLVGSWCEHGMIHRNWKMRSWCFNVDTHGI